ncbi:MAG: branched-chain amino acid ABC transporter permease [Candidatus Dadabacteria bacterium]|nr:MAG: branched-chain amino acid ABC transporter permease [Candidatus Dadabacteria bacterium]
MGLFAMSFNLLFGGAGLLSFGQAALFGVGSYGAALVLLHGPPSLGLAFVAGVGGAAAVAAVIGYLSVRRDEIFFAMLTLGFGMMLYTVAHNWREVTGGSDGLSGFAVPGLPGGISLYAPVHMYFFTLAVVAAGVVLLWRVQRSAFGLILRASRENRERLAFVGGAVPRYRLAAFVLSGALSGVAGVLFCLFNQMATPDLMHWSASARPVLMTILGGAGVFPGPLFGAAAFFALEQVVTHFTENWMLVLGAVLIPVVIFFPEGLLGTAVGFVRSRKGAGRG